MSDTTQSDVSIARIAADIVVAFVSRNPINARDVASLTLDVKAALTSSNGIGSVDTPQPASHMDKSSGVERHYGYAEDEPAASSEKADVRIPQPAVPISESVTPEHVYCLEDGKKFRSLKRHLRHEHNMTPEQYREKWGLPQNYQMVAPNYSSVRTKLAKEQGLGTRHERRSKAEGKTDEIVRDAAE